MNSLESRIVSRVLACTLTDEEQRERGRQLAEAIKAVDECDAAHETKRKAMKEELGGLQAEVDRLAGIVREGREDRSVQVRIDYDEARSLVHYTRLDTGELTESRAMTEDEKQRVLPFASRRAN